MPDILKAAKLTVDMIQRRDDMRHILGDRYSERAAEARRVIRLVGGNYKLDATHAALRIASKMSAAGYDPSIVIAGLVDELEADNA